MSYPKTHLTRAIRIAIMLSLIIAFFIISPLVILYTVGYRYNFTTKTVEQTGVLSIDILPADAKVTLDGVVQRNMPLFLPNRAPGIYTLKIEKPGYHTWEKDIEVKSKETTYVSAFSLLKNDLPEKLFDLSDTSYVDAANDGSFLSLQTCTKTNICKLDLYNTQAQTIKTILPPQSLPLTISWSDFSETVALSIDDTRTSTTPIFTYILLDPNNSQKTNTILFPQAPSFYWMHYGKEDGLAFRNTTSTLFVTQKTLETLPPVSPTTSFFLLDEQANYWTYTTTLQTLTLIPIDAIPKQFHIDVGITNLIYANNKTLFAKTERGLQTISIDGNQLHTNQLPFSHYRFDATLNKYLGWNDFELWGLDTSGVTQFYTRLGTPIQGLYALDTSGKLLIETADSLIAFDPKFSVMQTLFTHNDIHVIGVNTKKSSIYFTADLGKGRQVFELGY